MRGMRRHRQSVTFLEIGNAEITYRELIVSVGIVFIRKQTRDSCAESCEDFLGWVKVCDERPIPLKDNVVISDYGLSFIGYYDYNKRDREYFCDANTLEKIYECPSYWLKGLELHEQERIANKEYKQRLVARKEAENVLQTVSDADES